MKKSGFIALMMSILMVVGCGTNAGTGSLLGGGGGAAVGALLGQLIGKNTKSTVIGAAIGTAVGTTAGALIGKHMDKVKARAAAIENASVTEITDQNGLSASAVLNKPTGEIYVKVANISDQAQSIKLNLKGIKALTSGKVITLHSDNPIAENSIQRPDAIQPIEKEIEVSGSILDTEVPAKTFAVFVLK